YTVSDGQGGTNLGTVAVFLNSNIFDQTNPVTMALGSTNVLANFFGIPGDQYTVERSTNLTLVLVWVPISTNPAPPNGSFQVRDDFQDLGLPVPPLPSPVFY